MSFKIVPNFNLCANSERPALHPAVGAYNRTSTEWQPIQYAPPSPDSYTASRSRPYLRLAFPLVLFLFLRTHALRTALKSTPHTERALAGIVFAIPMSFAGASLSEHYRSCIPSLCIWLLDPLALFAHVRQVQSLSRSMYFSNILSSIESASTLFVSDPAAFPNCVVPLRVSVASLTPAMFAPNLIRPHIPSCRLQHAPELDAAPRGNLGR
ncbi:hypothetical protein DFH06DRAFT_1325349 [Mycena polygramma]|nr:hypothetical protein DFH06DRAFT_1325349 [Mycena polygramma]